jgi:uncharacterized protein
MCPIVQVTAYPGHTLDKGRTGRVQFGLDRTCTGEEVFGMKGADILAAILVIVGALNWGLVAIAEFDLVATIFGLEFGETNAITRVVYGLVGLSGLYLAARLPALARGESRRAYATT